MSDSCRRFVVQARPPEVFRVEAPTLPPPVKVVATERTGPPGKPGASAHHVEAENKAGATIHAGQAVGLDASGSGWILADQGATVTRAVGLAVETKANAVSLAVQAGDVLELSDWTAATGAPTLPPRSRWYLGTAGLLSQTPSTAGGTITQLVGEALTPHKLAIRIGPAIKRN